MKQIRSDIFETNSSSCHSVSLSREDIFQELCTIWDEEMELNRRKQNLYKYLAEMEETKTNHIEKEEWD